MTLVKFKDSDLLLDNAFKNFFGNCETGNNLNPRVEITEDRDNFYLDMELPGVKKEDVKVNVENNVLTISGKKNSTRKSEKNNLVMNERYFGEFSRSFNLTKDIKMDGIDAEFKDGVLNVTLPKIEEAKPVVKEVSIK
jgi:HSP20 family protein